MRTLKRHRWEFKLDPDHDEHVLYIEDEINESEIELRLSFLDLIKLQYKIGQYIGYHLEKE